MLSSPLQLGVVGEVLVRLGDRFWTFDYIGEDDDDIEEDEEAGVYILPKNWVFYKSLFGGMSFFINNNGQIFYKKR